MTDDILPHSALNNDMELVAATAAANTGPGTVTSISVASANGVSGAVATATTTPVITLALSDITPSSVAATGPVAGTSLVCSVAGGGVKIKEGSNATMGVATLVGGTATVSTTKVTADSRIVLTAQSLGTVVLPSALGVSARNAGVDFTILASAPTDTSVIAWMIVEPAA